LWLLTLGISDRLIFIRTKSFFCLSPKSNYHNFPKFNLLKIKMNKKRIFFPSNHPVFVGEHKLQHQIKSLESYHELTYDMLDIQNSIVAINRVAPQDEKTLRDKYSQYQIDENLTSALEELSDSYAKAEKNPVQKMRDALEEIKRDFDTATILLFICPQFF